MKQLVLKKGKSLVLDVESPVLEMSHILVHTKASCISPGTEIATLKSSGKSLFEKARAHPEKLKRSLKRMKNEGLRPVLTKAIEKQDQEIAIGYTAAGVVVDAATDVRGFQKGMRVAIAGAGHANHAEICVVPKNLSIPIPDNVSFTEASTCALGGIAIQGVRRSEAALCDIIAVYGCGAIGLVTIQLLKANGCNVVALDIDDRRLELAAGLGADATFNARRQDLTERVYHYTGGHGVDKVIICASTDSNDVLSSSFNISRRKGRVVLVGVIGSQFNRQEMYQKELDFVISTSYGPGRYDEQYERFGHDYPYGYVRWTEKRNMEAYLKLISAGSVRLDKIIEDSFPIDRADEAYERLQKEQLLLVTLRYPETADVTAKGEGEAAEGQPAKSWSQPRHGSIKLGLVGAGSFVKNMHLPNLKRLSDLYRVSGVCNRTGLSAQQVAKQFNECRNYTAYNELLGSDVDAVLIGTRHNSHADQTIKALEAGKAVFVEKPMCIHKNEYSALCRAVEKSSAPFMVGYNRRFSPFAQFLEKQVHNRINPLILQYTMNAGYIPYNAWIHTSEGGGRIIGEACHIIDLFRFIIGSPAISVSVDSLAAVTESVRPDDNAVITLKYQDGSVATLLYTAIGSKEVQKESLRLFCDETLYEMNDYKNINTNGGPADLALKKQDKGHLLELKVFAQSISQGNRFPIPWSQLKETWEITRLVADSLRTGA
jgi:predicted dehydrogenase/threonine dehydrogenase-like Zn-dependent dehydrogenase